MDASTSCWNHDVGKLLLRVTIGGLLLLHGVHKIMHSEDLTGIKQAVTKQNLPEAMAYGVYVGEVFGAALVLIGFFTRVAAAIVAINMGVAIWLAHIPILWTLNDGGGWAVELQAMYLLGAVCIIFLGAGAFSVDGMLSGRGQIDDTPPPPPPTKK